MRTPLAMTAKLVRQYAQLTVYREWELDKAEPRPVPHGLNGVMYRPDTLQAVLKATVTDLPLLPGTADLKAGTVQLLGCKVKKDGTLSTLRAIESFPEGHEPAWVREIVSRALADAKEPGILAEITEEDTP